MGFSSSGVDSELAAVLRAMPVLYFRMDSEGVILEYSATCEEDLYVRPEEFMGKRMCEVLPPDVGKQFSDAIQEVQTAGHAVVKLEYVLPMKGERKSFEARLVRFADSSVIAGIRDITELKEATELLECTVVELRDAQDKEKAYAAELARSNRELEQFSHIVSHELQEPVRGIGLYAGILEESLRTGDIGEAQRWLSRIRESSDRMSALIRDMLSYSKLGGEERHPETVDCQNLLQAALADLQAPITETSAQIAADPLPAVCGDRARIMLLFQNVIANALKFRKEGECPKVHISARRDTDKWVFTVKDEGIGIPPKAHERIFGMFQRLHPRDKFPGTGLGLALCRKIVEQHGGRMWAESEPGQGAAFMFTLPPARE